MKTKNLIFLLIASLLTSCSIYKYDPNLKDAELSNAEKKLIVKFEKAVNRHNVDRFFSCLDDDYLKEEFINFYGGDTTNFINDFFGGDIEGSQKFLVVDFQDIKKITFQKLEEKNGYRYVYFRIQTQDNTVIICILTLNDKKKQRLIGDYG